MPRGVRTPSQILPMFAGSPSRRSASMFTFEEVGLVTSSKLGRVRSCQLDPAGLAMLDQWFIARRTIWERRLDALGAILASTTADRPRAEPSLNHWLITVLSRSLQAYLGMVASLTGG
jgi:hypothetical protein